MAALLWLGCFLRGTVGGDRLCSRKNEYSRRRVFEREFLSVRFLSVESLCAESLCADSLGAELLSANESCKKGFKGIDH